MFRRGAGSISGSAGRRTLPVTLAAGAGRAGLTKRLLRRVFAAELPAAVRERRDKVGFGAPPWRWLVGPLRPLVEDLLASATLRSLPFLRRDRLQADFAQVLAGNARGEESSDGFWRALNVLLWLQAKGFRCRATSSCGASSSSSALVVRIGAVVVARFVALAGLGITALVAVCRRGAFGRCRRLVGGRCRAVSATSC